LWSQSITVAVAASDGGAALKASRIKAAFVGSAPAAKAAPDIAALKSRAAATRRP